jgi:hypothetical protein
MDKIAKYRVAFHGSADGFQNSRAKIRVFKAGGFLAQNFLGEIRFHDPGMTFGHDSEASGVIIMNLPSAMLANVLDVLRNEKPVFLHFKSGHAFLRTGAEPAGEEE